MAKFALDRFELVGGERYEVEGRWSGVRGRVFMRPELTLSDGKQSRRLLADLAHKPWQAADGDQWAVAFPSAGEPIEVRAAELTVTPDITVAVKRRRTRAAGGGKAWAGKAGGGGKAGAGKAGAGKAGAGKATAGEASVTRGQSERTQASKRPQAQAKPETAGRRRGLGVQFADAQSELEQLHSENRALAGRLEAATRRAEESRAELDRSARMREQLAAERDGAISGSEDARAEADRVIRDAAEGLKVVQRSRDEAIGELTQARDELEHAREALLLLTSERDSAIRAGIEVERELHVANNERDELIKERDQLAAEQGFLQGELKRLSALGVTRPQLHAGYGPDPAGQQQSGRPPEPSSASFSWGETDRWPGSAGPALRSRAVALLALTAAVVAVVVVLATVVL